MQTYNYELPANVNRAKIVAKVARDTMNLRYIFVVAIVLLFMPTTGLLWPALKIAVAVMLVTRIHALKYTVELLIKDALNDMPIAVEDDQHE